MTRILHVIGNGHICHNPINTLPPASYIKAGERLQVGNAELFYYTSPSASTGVYLVYDRAESALPASKRTFYEFTNLNCAAAKLADMGAKVQA